MSRFVSMLWPSICWIHGIGVLLLLGLTLGFGPGFGYAKTTIVFAITWLVFVLVQRWKHPELTLLSRLSTVDWLLITFVGLICVSFTWQGWDKPWVLANARLIPFYVIAPYVCGRFMLRQDLLKLPVAMLTLLAVMLVIFAWGLVSVEGSRFGYRPVLAGTDELTARISVLVAQASVVTTYLLLRAKEIRVSYVLLLAFLAILLTFLGLRALALSGICVVAFASFKAEWLPLGRRMLIGSIFLFSIAAINFAMYHSDFQAHKNVGELLNATQASDGAASSSTCSENARKQNSVAIRLELLQDAFRQFMISPVIGVGAGAYGQQSCWSDLVAHPHNVLAQAGAEIGLLGISILVGMIVVAGLPYVNSAWSANPIENLAFLLFLLALLNFLISGNYFTATEFWWAIGMIVSVNSRESEHFQGT